MGDLVNLNKYRKQRNKKKEGSAVAARRARHGLSRAERERDAAERERAHGRLDGNALEPPDHDPPPVG